MTKADLIQQLTERMGTTPRESRILVEAIYDTIIQSMWNGEKFPIRGFGTFSTRLVKPRAGQDSRTAAGIPAPTMRVPHFKPSKELKRFVNLRTTAPEGPNGLEI